MQPNEATIKKGEKLTITANINPANATNKTIEFISGNEDIVTIGEQTINEDGTVSVEITGIKEGNTTIMAKSKHGENGKEITQSCTVEVTTNIVYIYNEGVFNSNFPVQEINITAPDPNHYVTRLSYANLTGFITKNKVNFSNYSKIGITSDIGAYPFCILMDFPMSGSPMPGIKNVITWYEEDGSVIYDISGINEFGYLFFGQSSSSDDTSFNVSLVKHEKYFNIIFPNGEKYISKFWLE